MQMTTTLSMVRNAGSVPNPPGGPEATRLMRDYAAGGGRFAQPAGWALPAWASEGWVVDQTSDQCSAAQDWPFLRTGVAPRVGQRLYMAVSLGWVGG